MQIHASAIWVPGPAPVRLRRGAPYSTDPVEDGVGGGEGGGGGACGWSDGMKAGSYRHLTLATSWRGEGAGVGETGYGKGGGRGGGGEGGGGVEAGGGGAGGVR